MKNTDIYFVRSKEVLVASNHNPIATMEVFSRKSGILCGTDEVLSLLDRAIPLNVEPFQVCMLDEGSRFSSNEVVMTIKAPLQSFIELETIYLGILASRSAWATAAKECVEAAAGIPVISFGARHIHPMVAGVMDESAILGGCIGCSSVEGAERTCTEPIGTMPHALIIAFNSTYAAMEAFNKHMDKSVPRVALVDTFRDEVRESVAMAMAFGKNLKGVRLDTPSERGGVTVGLVKEVRAWLDLYYYQHVKITVSGGFTPDKIKKFVEEKAPVDFFGVGSYISGTKPIDFTADIHELDGEPIAKRGRVPGLTKNDRLENIVWRV